MSRRPARRSTAIPATELRIIGGKLRGSKLAYNGDPGTRPMKERVREAAFNLIGPSIKGMLAIDLFAGTGALGLEALSRGASRAMFIERHRPTAKTLLQNIAALGVEERSEVTQSDTFYWARSPGFPTPAESGQDSSPTDDVANLPGKTQGTAPWAVFCSPPYALYQERAGDMLDLIAACMKSAPPESCVVVEADESFDYQSLPQPDDWDVRRYAPAMLGILRTS